MSISQEAFRLVNGDDKGDLSRYMDYIEQLSHEGVPGEAKYLNLPVKDTDAVIRLLSEMVKIAIHPGAWRYPVSLRGLADQLLHIYTRGAAPSWAVEEDEDVTLEVPEKDYLESLITAIVIAGRMHQDATVTIRFKGHPDFLGIFNVINQLDDTAHRLLSDESGALPEVRLESYLQFFGWARIRATFPEMKK